MTNPGEEKPCIACSWTPTQQKQCHYTSTVKLIHSASTRGIWSLGSEVILKDCPDEGRKSRLDVLTLNFLNAHSSLPVPRVLRDWVDREGRYFVMNERIHGQTLEEVWFSLSVSVKSDIADQVVALLQEVRGFTSDSI